MFTDSSSSLLLLPFLSFLPSLPSNLPIPSSLSLSLSPYAPPSLLPSLTCPPRHLVAGREGDIELADALSKLSSNSDRKKVEEEEAS
jgi:hypothetical protein